VEQVILDDYLLSDDTFGQHFSHVNGTIEYAFTRGQMKAIASAKVISASLTLISTIIFLVYVAIFKRKKLRRNKNLRLLVYLQTCSMLSALGNTYILGTYQIRKVNTFCYIQGTVVLIIAIFLTKCHNSIADPVF
jgi:uncharacterized membrane protein